MKNITYSFFVARALKLVAVLSALSFATLFSLSAQAQLMSLQAEPKLQKIADELIAEGYYSQSELDSIFAKSRHLQSVLDAMKNPAEYKLTWGKYRKIFLQDDRIQQGVDFWKEHQETLNRAEQQYGVPASVIVAIIGVESKFGKYRGKHKVLDSLATLVIDFPRRSAFFAKELKQFLILCKENQLDSNAVLGSYAGAVGYPQFISSSYRNYAVDFSGDGITDLINQPVDAIGSVANYFIENGWKPGQAVTAAPQLSVDPRIEELANRKRKVKYSAAELRALGAVLDTAIDDQTQLNVLMLDASEVVQDDKRKDIYIVRSGDTACQIAEKFEVPCAQLFKMNKLNSNGAIFRGQRLKLPSVKTAKSVAVTPAESNSKWAVKGNAVKADEPELSTVQQRFFYTHKNFYAITQYNHSVLYAMAVHDLSMAIAQANQQRNDADSTIMDSGLEPQEPDSSSLDEA